MEKLIDLLNEYDEYAFPEKHPHTEYPDGWVDDGDYRYIGHKYLLGQNDGLNFSCASSVKNSGLNHLYIISKEFGFIERLINNDKVDLIKFPQINEHSDYECLLMRLSIADNPINYLCSILK